MEQGLLIYAPGVPVTPLIDAGAYETVLPAFGLGAVPFDKMVDNSSIEA